MPAFRHSTSRHPSSCFAHSFVSSAAPRETEANESRSHSTVAISVADPWSLANARTSSSAAALRGDARFSSTTRFAPRSAACFASQIPSPFAVAPVTATVFPAAASWGM